MKQRILLIFIPVFLILLSIIWYTSVRPTTDPTIVVNPSFGQFVSTVTTTGELQAEKSIEIMGPVNARAVRIWQMKISEMVPEGTILKEGDFVAELDKSELMNSIKDIELNIQKFESQYEQAKLDSALNLSNARDELENIKYNLEEKKLLMEQSAYEPPAIIRQAEINYEREQRNLKQKKKNYNTKVQQAIAKLKEVGSDLSKEQSKYELYMNTLMQFTITAPSEGMIIYRKTWNGKKINVGSTIDAWNPVVAKLPDLTSMKSITYVNEVDIQKVKEGQKVEIGLDADPYKKLTGKVIEVANIGEQLRNSDSKVFEVVVKVDENDFTLLPAMTTSNKILVHTIDSALFIPLECIHTEMIKDNDEESKVTYVYKENGSGSVKQEVKIGLMNDNDAVVLEGVDIEDELYLSKPENADEIELVRLVKDKTNNQPDN